MPEFLRITPTDAELRQDAEKARKAEEDKNKAEEERKARAEKAKAKTAPYASPHSGAVSGAAKERRKIVIVDTSESIEQHARDSADAKMTADRKELKGFSGLVKRVWKYNWIADYTRNREIGKARAAIRESGNIYANETGEKVFHDKAMEAVVQRFESDIAETVHRENGEKLEKFDSFDRDGKIKAELQNLIRDYASGKLDDATYIEAEKRVFGDVQNAAKGVIDQGEIYASNVYGLAKEFRKAIEQGAKLEDLDLDFDVSVGKAKMGVRTEAQFNAVDRIVHKIKKTAVGQLINETALASAVAIASSVAKKTSRSFASSKAAAWATFGGSALVSTAVAGAVENKRLKEERRQHAREMAQGKKFDAAEAVRRVQFEQARYETRDAMLLSESLEQKLYEFDKDGHKVERELSQEQFDAAMKDLAETNARILISDRENIDLVGYSDVRSVEQERTRLDIVRAQAKNRLRNLVENGKVAIPAGKEFEQHYESLLAENSKNLVEGDSGIEKKNELFNKMRRKEVGKKMLGAFWKGLAIGAVGQEIGSFFNDHQQGVIEGTFGMNKAATHYTPVEYMRRLVMGSLHKVDNEHLHNEIIAQNTFKIPDGFEMVRHANGEYALVGNNGADVLVDHLHLKPDGSLDTSSLEHLHEAGIGTQVTRLVGAHSAPHAAVRNFIDSHPDDFHHVRRDMWYDNNTPAPVFDKNELKLWWGGEHNTGLDDQGNFVFNIKHMRPDGSFHKEFSANAQELMKEGKVKMLLSMSKETQSQVVEIPIDAHGNAIIDPNSEIAKVFFKTDAHGHAVFLGKYAEVAQDMGAKNGVEHVRLLATHVGADNAEGMALPIHNTRLEIPGDYTVDPPAYMPVLGRYPLERAAGDPVPADLAYYYLSGKSQETPNFRPKTSEQLRSNPDSNLNYREELKHYFENQDPKYMELVRDLANQDKLMNKETRLAIAIPVAGHQESKNIYRTLENYTYQTANPNSFEIQLFVNNPKVDLSGKKLDSSETLKEIERFKKEHPEIAVRVITQELDPADAKIGKIRKIGTDVLLYRSLSRGSDAPELIVVSNDADNYGVAPEYVQNYIEKFDAHPETDLFKGQLDWDAESYQRNPLVHVGTRMFQYVDIQGRVKGGGMVSSGGNSAFRSSIYAAIGGYNPELRGGEDTDFGSRILKGRFGAKNKKPLAFAGSARSRLYTSARRAEEALRRGLAPVEQWSGVFGAFDDEVRKTDWAKEGRKFDLNNEADVRSLVDGLEHVVNRTLRAHSNWDNLYNEHSPDKRAINWLGLKYDIVGPNRIKITDASRLIEGLRRYQDQAQSILERKTGRVRPARAARTTASANTGPESSQEPQTQEQSQEQAPQVREPIFTNIAGQEIRPSEDQRLEAEAKLYGVNQRRYERVMKTDGGPLEKLVSAGVITGDQADQFRTRIKEQLSNPNTSRGFRDVYQFFIDKYKTRRGNPPAAVSQFLGEMRGLNKNVSVELQADAPTWATKTKK